MCLMRGPLLRGSLETPMIYVSVRAQNAPVHAGTESRCGSTKCHCFSSVPPTALVWGLSVGRVDAGAKVAHAMKKMINPNDSRLKDAPKQKVKKVSPGSCLSDTRQARGGNGSDFACGVYDRWLTAEELHGV